MKIQFFLFFIILSLSGYSQDTIPIKNPSFEGDPFMGDYLNFPLEKWIDFGSLFFPQETQYDLHGSDSDFWGLNVKAFDGNTFVGLVTRDNGSHEIIGQKLDNPLVKDSILSDEHLCICK